jgi:hypothetical protein
LVEVVDLDQLSKGAVIERCHTLSEFQRTFETGSEPDSIHSRSLKK